MRTRPIILAAFAALISIAGCSDTSGPSYMELEEGPEKRCASTEQAQQACVGAHGSSSRQPYCSSVRMIESSRARLASAESDTVSAPFTPAAPGSADSAMAESRAP